MLEADPNAQALNSGKYTYGRTKEVSNMSKFAKASLSMAKGLREFDKRHQRSTAIP